MIRVFDTIVAVVGLILAAPFLVLAAVGIKLSSRGPVIYRAAEPALVASHPRCLSCAQWGGVAPMPGASPAHMIPECFDGARCYEVKSLGVV